MFINDILQSKKISKYRLAKDSGVPYSTVADIVSGKTRLEKSSAEVVYKLAKALDVSMEELVEPYVDKPLSFELFKSNVCHGVKRMGDIPFILDVLESGIIWEYYDKKKYPESLYMLAMLDYLSRINEVPLVTDFDDLRHARLKETIYPSSVIAEYNIHNDEGVREKAKADAIPEFLRFNIVEGDIRNVI